MFSDILLLSSSIRFRTVSVFTVIYLRDAIHMTSSFLDSLAPATYLLHACHNRQTTLTHFPYLSSSSFLSAPKLTSGECYSHVVLCSDYQTDSFSVQWLMFSWIMFSWIQISREIQTLFKSPPYNCRPLRRCPIFSNSSLPNTAAAVLPKIHDTGRFSNAFIAVHKLSLAFAP